MTCLAHRDSEKEQSYMTGYGLGNMEDDLTKGDNALGLVLVS